MAFKDIYHGLYMAQISWFIWSLSQAGVPHEWVLEMDEVNLGPVLSRTPPNPAKFLWVPGPCP